jgi:hypothetical protein
MIMTILGLFFSPAHAADALGGTSLGDELDLTAWTRSSGDTWSRPATVVLVPGLLTATMCGDAVGKLSFRAGWTNAADGVVTRSAATVQQKGAAAASGSSVGVGVAGQLPSGAVGVVGASRSSGTESYKASSKGSVEAASVQVAAENDLRVAAPSGIAKQAFYTFSDAMREKDWVGRVPVTAPAPDARRETRYFSRNGAERILDLYCTASSGSQTSCEVRLTTSDSECTDGI